MAKRGRPKKQATSKTKADIMQMRYGWNINQTGSATKSTKGLIANINRTIRQFYDAFGKDSKEYKDIQKMIVDIVGLDVDIISPPNAKYHDAIRLSQSKKALDYWQNNKEDLQNLRYAQKNYGTATEHMQAYRSIIGELNQFSGTNYKYTKADIKSVAEKLEYYRDNQAEIYAYINAEGTPEEIAKASEIVTKWNTSYGNLPERYRLDTELYDLYKDIMSRGTKFNSNATDKGTGLSEPIKF